MAERYETAKSKQVCIEEKIQERTAKHERITEFLKVLNNTELLTEFDEDLWNAVVENIIVYSDNNLAITFRDGSLLSWKIK